MIDFHTHILPNMDDGSSNVEESLYLLNVLENEGVDTVCLTPHFYPNNEEINEFILRRNKAYKELIKEYKGSLKLLLGAEVRYFRGISNYEEIKQLCLENTNLLLLELPFNEPISDSMLTETIKLSKNFNLKIVLAHIERYDIDNEMIKNLKNSGILIQANTESFIGFISGKTQRNRLKMGLIDLIGSDSHNKDTRIPNYEKATNILNKKVGKDIVTSLDNRSKALIVKS